MGLLSGNKPYTAISSAIERMTAHNGGDNDAADLLELIELVQIRPQAGTAEAGRALRKRLKYGNTQQKARALALVEMIVDNGGKKMGPMVADTGLGDYIQTLSRSGERRIQKRAQRLLVIWQDRDSTLSQFSPAPKATSASQHAPRGDSHYRGRSRDNGRFADRDSHLDEHPGEFESPSQSRTRSPSRSPSPINLRGKSLTATVSLAHSVATRLSNSLILKDGNVRASREARGYYKQAKEVRHRVIQLVTDDSPEVVEFLEQLLRANEELVAAIQAYDDVLNGRAPAQRHDDVVDDPVRPLRRAPERTSRGPSRDVSRERARSSSREETPPPMPSRPRAASRPSVPASPRRSPEPVSDDDNPFADSNEASNAPLHTPIW